MIQNKEIDKIAEFIEKLNQGYRPKCSDSIENFSDGSLVNEFWNNHRKKIKNELDSNVKYKDGYDVARETVRLCFEKIEKRANKKLVKGLCLENGIDVSKYKSFLNKSYDEVYVKLCYLKDYGIPVVDNGIIHPIFFMSDINMQVEYHVSLDDLMRQYLKVIKEKGM